MPQATEGISPLVFSPTALFWKKALSHRFVLEEGGTLVGKECHFLQVGWYVCHQEFVFISAYRVQPYKRRWRSGTSRWSGNRLNKYLEFDQHDHFREGWGLHSSIKGLCPFTIPRCWQDLGPFSEEEEQGRR